MDIDAMRDEIFARDVDNYFGTTTAYCDHCGSEETELYLYNGCKLCHYCLKVEFKSEQQTAGRGECEYCGKQKKLYFHEDFEDKICIDCLFSEMFSDGYFEEYDFEE